MKIAQVVCVFPPYRGGIGNSAYYFARGLADQGHEVTVFTPDYSFVGGFLKSEFEDSANGGRREEGKKFNVVRLKPWFQRGNAAFLPQLFWRLSGFDIVHFHYPFYGAAEPTLLRKMLFGEKMKLVVHYHMEPAGKGVRELIFKLDRLFVLPALVKSAKAITCASLDYVKHSGIAGFYWKYKKKFKQTFFGVDPGRFSPRPISGRRGKINSVGDGVKSFISKGAKNVLFVSRLDSAHYFKGLDVLLKAIKIVNQDLPFKVGLNVVGDGDLRPRYQDLAEKLKIGELVNFAGQVGDEELARYYRRCDCFVLPSINKGEAFGLVLLEAMACGRPVIASNLPGVRSVFKNGEQGLSAKPNDADSLASKLKIILKDDDLAQRMGRAGRKLVEDKYTWDKVGERLDLIYHYVMYSPD